ncbi:transposase [Nocardia farcinica]|nr:transposase [Nocardia farcinica]
MARAQRVSFADRPDTYTVVGRDELPIDAAQEYLRFVSASGRSPNTVRSYARGLAEWWTVLEHTGDAWDDFPTSRFGDYLMYLRYGELPGVHRIGARTVRLAESSVGARSAAVLAMYTYHADAHHLTVPYNRLFSARRNQRRRRPYRGFLHGVGPHYEADTPIYRSRTPSRSITPVLQPAQVTAILDACAVQTEHGWSGRATGLRDRFLFAVLAETGMRVGEALSLRHHDIHISGGGTPFIDVPARDDHPHGLRSKTRDRRIYIGDDLAALYTEYVWQLIDLGADVTVSGLDTHFVFVNLAHGQRFAPMRVETVYARVRSIRRCCSGYVPADWSPHWLRHTHATALLLNGIPPHVVMRRLGHADVQTTLSTYGWVTEDAELRALSQWKNYVAGWKGIHDAQS